jgi:hypothetical protein
VTTVKIGGSEHDTHISTEGFSETICLVHSFYTWNSQDVAASNDRLEVEPSMEGQKMHVKAYASDKCYKPFETEQYPLNGAHIQLQRTAQ